MKVRRNQNTKGTLESISVGGAPASLGNYSHIVRPLSMGITVPLCGVSGRDPVTNIVPEGGIHAEATQAFKNIETILESVALQLDDIMRIEVQLQSLDDVDEFNEVFAKKYPKDSFQPTRFVHAPKAIRTGVIELICTAFEEKKIH